MSHSARQRSDDFLQIADQFKLGELITEGFHPITQHLSEVAGEDVAAALRLLFQVDGDVVRKYREVADSGRLQQIAAETLNSLHAGGRIFLTGCGSTGRLSILLDSIWRDFWRQERARGLKDESSFDEFENRTFSVMAGGDFALIKAVEGFEDYSDFGRKQIKDLGVRAGDVVFAITEGGETSFVIGTAWEGVDAGAKVYFVYNNPDDVLCAHVQRSREVIEDDRIDKLNLTTGPMAISGSTRMQATSIQLCVLVSVFELVVRELCGAIPDKDDDVPRQFLSGLESLQQSLLSKAVLDGLASLVSAEVDAYRSGGRANYYADRFAIDVLTDTTERSPTFSTPAFRQADDAEASESWSFLCLPQRSSEQAWQWILKRNPNCLSWTEADVRELVPSERLTRTGQVLAAIRESELMRFRVGRDAMASRSLRENDFGLGIVSAVGSPTSFDDPGSVEWMDASGDSGAKPGLLCFTTGSLPQSVEARIGASDSLLRLATVQVPATGFLLDGLTRVAVKMALNAISTCVMVRLGRVMGNTMIYVVPSNLKLIDRATRYISRLAKLDYEEANRQLFEVIEHVEPRMLAGQSYPPVVGLAVIRVRDRISLDEAEQRTDGEG